MGVIIQERFMVLTPILINRLWISLQIHWPCSTSPEIDDMNDNPLFPQRERARKKHLIEYLHTVNIHDPSTSFHTEELK